MSAAPAAQAADKPNILLVIVDDMGLDASPCHNVGLRKPNMPLLSRMCREGLVFDNFYTAPTCSPTRATILTGRYGFRTGVGTAIRPGNNGYLKPGNTTLFNLLASYTPDYDHAVIGKWHLASFRGNDTSHPAKLGVQGYRGLLTGRVNSYSSWPFTKGGKITKNTSYITSRLHRRGHRMDERPFFPLVSVAGLYRATYPVPLAA